MTSCSGPAQYRSNPGNYVLEHAYSTGSTRQHKLQDIYKIGNISVLKDLHHEVGTNHTDHLFLGQVGGQGRSSVKESNRLNILLLVRGIGHGQAGKGSNRLYVLVVV